jgi:transcriptional regulator with XRE-family HTH domain
MEWHEIRRNRKILGLTQQQLSRKLGLSGGNATIGNWETGRYTISQKMKDKLDEVLKVTQEQLNEYYEKEQMKAESKKQKSLTISSFNQMAKECGLTYGQHYGKMKYKEIWGERRLAK